MPEPWERWGSPFDTVARHLDFARESLPRTALGDEGSKMLGVKLAGPTLRLRPGPRAPV